MPIGENGGHSVRAFYFLKMGSLSERAVLKIKWWSEGRAKCESLVKNKRRVIQ